MKVAIMQPYFFPYIGYWQLINAVDTFVIYDDVNYIKSGWINRNCILENGKRVYFTLETKGASSFKLINQIQTGDNSEKLIKTLQQNYSRALFFIEIISLLTDLLSYKEKNLAKFLTRIIKRICASLSIQTRIIVSSEFFSNQDLKGKNRVLDICRLLDGDAYINSIGGKLLYDHESFEQQGIQLNFLESTLIPYTQFGEEFVPWLSIIDLMMFNPIEKIQNMLLNYRLVN